MMRKIHMLMLVLLLLVLVGCSADQDVINDPNENENPAVILADDVPNRKIIYQVTMSINVTNLDEAIDDLSSRLESDEWFDQETITESQAYYVIRIKTDRLDAFIKGIKDDYAINRYEKSGTDISLQYQDKANRILAIEAQIERLNDLYATASLSDMIVINQQLSTLEVELQRLNGEILVFDSLVDYSEVHLTVYGSLIVTESPFFNRLGHAFLTGFSAFVGFLDGLVIVIATVLPFAIVFGGGGLGVVYLVKRHNKKLDLKKQLKDNESK